MKQKFTKLSNNHGISPFIFCSKFDDERMINYEWPNKELEYKTRYKDIKFKETVLSELINKNNRIFKNLYIRKFITENELKYLSYDFEKTTNLGKLYLLPKIHKRLYNVPGRLVISSCGTPSEFLDFHLKPLMQSDWSSSQGFVSSNYRCGRSISKHTTQRGDLSIKKQIRRTNLLKNSY